MLPANAAALSGAAAVLLGAFGAHALKHLDAKALANWGTAASYHLVHSVLLLHAAKEKKTGACWLLSGGIALFSGSLYVLTLSGQKWLGAITPIGGLMLVGGWVALAY